jgi:hypothetical protein
MKNSITDRTLTEIREAQAEIAAEMDNSQLSRDSMRNLEKASLVLRNMERSLVDSIEIKLIADLKSGNSALKALIGEMEQSSGQLSRVNEILGKVVKVTGQLIDILIKVA